MLTSLRLAASGVITALAALITVYPHITWIPVVMAVASAVGIHAIPAVTQSGGTTVTTPQSGPELMGIAKPVSNTSSTPETADSTPVETVTEPNTDSSATESATTEATTVASDTVTAVEDTAEVAPAVEAVPGVTEAVQAVRDAFESLMKLVSGHL